MDINEMKAELELQNAQLEERENVINQQLAQIQQEAEKLILERSQNAAVHVNNKKLLEKFTVEEIHTVGE